MSQEKIHDLLNYIFLGAGTTTAGVALNFQIADEIMSLVVKGISVLSFLVFLLINQDKIEEGWKKLITRLYNNLPYIFKKKK